MKESCKSFLISIPLRYDYKKKLPPCDVSCPLFQFLYGTIISTISFSFISMRLISIPLRYDYKEGKKKQRFPLNIISIPLRYDYKYFYRQALHRSYEFQFLYGTIISVISNYRVKCNSDISIPLRYDYKAAVQNSKIPVVAISIPLRYDYKLQQDKDLLFPVNFNSFTVRL